MFALLFGFVRFGCGGLGFLFCLRCSDNAIAMACLTFCTTGPFFEPLCSFPVLYSFITFLILFIIYLVPFSLLLLLLGCWVRIVFLLLCLHVFCGWLQRILRR